MTIHMATISLVILLSACTDMVSQLAEVTTTAIVDNLDFTVRIAGTSASGGGDVLDEGSSVVTERGLCWNTTGSPTTNDNKAADGSGAGLFTNASLTGLLANTMYYVRAYAINSQGTAYGIEITFNSGYAHGTDYAGGYTFYNDGSGGGLVCAKTDQSSSLRWHNGSLIVTGAVSTAIASGQANTSAIVTSQGDGSYAAKLCDDLDSEGHTDWYLPSRDEMNLMYTVLRANSIGGFAESSYWSSSETSAMDAWRQYFGNGNQYESDKGLNLAVRAVRAF